MRLNALHHGITSRSPVIPGMEDEDEWKAHLDGMRQSLAPEGHFEQVLADRIANLTWRLYRVTHYEIAVTMRYIDGAALAVAASDKYGAALAQVAFTEPHPDRIDEAQHTRILPSDSDLDRIMRYETHLHRQCLQTLHELEALQARRNGLPVHLARLDISSPPPG